MVSDRVAVVASCSEPSSSLAAASASTSGPVAHIDTDALQHNLGEVRRLVGPGVAVLILRAFLGIASMFVLNLSVAFTLSLSAAVRAYNVTPADVRSIARALWTRLLTRPRDFVLPPAR